MLYLYVYALSLQDTRNCLGYQTVIIVLNSIVLPILHFWFICKVLVLGLATFQKVQVGTEIQRTAAEYQPIHLQKKISSQPLQYTSLGFKITTNTLSIISSQGNITPKFLVPFHIYPTYPRNYPTCVYDDVG